MRKYKSDEEFYDMRMAKGSIRTYDKDKYDAQQQNKCNDLELK